MRQPDDAATVDAGGPDALLATKLHLPDPRPGLVSRPRLLERLDAHPSGDVTLVCAPAGSGKTMLLAEWARSHRGVVAWVSLDDDDNDPARFWRYVTTALQRVRPRLPAQTASLQSGPQPAPARAVMTALVNALADVEDHVALVLDDYHVITTEDVHATVRLFLANLPASVRMIITSRAEPPLPLGRLRAEGRVTEVRAADLRFTVDEAAELLSTAVGPGLPAGTVATLQDRTEGWAAGLQLAALSLAGRSDIARLVDAFTGSHRYMLDYLTEEVLDRQPPELRTFLLETSVARQVSGPLCDAMTGRSDSQDLLEAIERANLFLVPLDDERRWWRYHHLFGDLLRARLSRERPERVRRLHGAASAWFEASGYIDDAIHHALAAADTMTAAALVERHFDVLLRRSEDTIVRRWIDALPADVVAGNPRLRLAEGFLAIHRADITAVGHAVAAAADLAAAERSVDATAGMLGDVGAAITVQRAAVAHLRGDAQRTRRLARQALTELGDGHWLLRSIAQWHLAAGAWLSGELAEAEEAFISWHDGHDEDPSVAVWGDYYLGRVQHARGHLRAAQRTYERALEVAAGAGSMATQNAGPALVGTAEVDYELGDLDRAQARVVDGLTRCRQLAHGQPLAAGLVLLARIRHAGGDAAGAADALREADAVNISHGAVGLLNPARTARARMTLMSGSAADVAHLLARTTRGVPDDVSYAREAEHLILARVLLADDAADQALDLLARLRAHALAQGRTTSVIEIQALQARTVAASGDRDRALATLRETLVLAAPEGFVRTFVDEGAAIADLLGSLTSTATALRELADAGVPLAYVERLLAAFEGAGLPVGGRPARATMDALLTPLTEREAEVLTLLAAGNPNKVIAAELFISLDTVKRHVTHILDKLGADNRTEAASRARALGLLDTR